MSLSNNLAKIRGFGKLAKIGVTQTGKARVIRLFGLSFSIPSSEHVIITNWMHLTKTGRMIRNRIIIWLAPWAGKTNQIARCHWLPERARWGYLARSGVPAESREKNFPKSQIINPSLTKLVRSRWLDIGLGLFCEFIDLDSVSVHKHAKKELGQYIAIWTSHLVNNPYILPIEMLITHYNI